MGFVFRYADDRVEEMQAETEVIEVRKGKVSNRGVMRVIWLIYRELE